MYASSSFVKPRGREVAAALLLYLLITVLSVWAAALKPATTSTALLAAAVIAAGTVAMGLLVARWSAYPRWSVIAAAAILGLAALVGPLLVPDPAAWRADVRPMLWMHPWLIMVMGWVPPGSRRGWCSATAPGAGWILVGTATLLAGLSYVVAWVTTRM